VKVKEAIEFINEAIEMARKGNIIPTLQECSNEFNQVISLLQQLDKYRQMWEEFKKKYGKFCFNEFSDKPKLAVWVMMDGFKQKYFPKEAKQDES